jgi:hypothetical protein
MRRTLILASCSSAALALALWACSSSSDNPNVVIPSDAATEGGDDAGEGGNPFETGGPLPDATTNVCTLADHTTDPVAICIQQQVIGFELQYAYVADAGVAPTWASTGSFAAGTGPHRWQDDLGLAGTLGAYYCSSEVYGNNASTATFDAVLRGIAPVLIAELQQSPPTGTDGETYFRLRWAQAAYNYVNDGNASVVQGIADAFGQGLAAHAYTVPASGGGDAGAAADGGDGGAGDAGSAGSPGGTVIGKQNPDGTVAYAPAQSIMAAAALLDMAILHEKDADAGSAPAAWVASAQSTLDYVLARGLDPKNGLFYPSLVTSGDPGHDALDPSNPAGDTFLTEDQAWAMLGLARAQDLLAVYYAALHKDAGADASGVLQQTYGNAGANLAEAVATAGLFDGSTSPGSPPPVGAFFEGVGPSGVLTNKTTIGNAIMLGAFHRIVVGSGSNYGYELGEVRSALLQFTPVRSSLFTVVADQNGNPIQQAYLRAASKSFDYAVTYTGDGGTGGQEPGATDYRSDAVHAFVEGITQLWHGSANNPTCAP